MYTDFAAVLNNLNIFSIIISYLLLHEIHSLVGKTPCSYGTNRNEPMILTRCRIGRCKLAQTEQRPECILCLHIATIR